MSIRVDGGRVPDFEKVTGGTAPFPVLFDIGDIVSAVHCVACPYRPISAIMGSMAKISLADRRDVALLTVITMLFLLLAGSYSAATPFNPVKGYARLDRGQSNPDEHAHYEYIQTVAAGHLPVMTEGYTEAHQPPLYYLVAAAVYRLAGGEGPRSVIAIRWLSIAIGVGLIFATYGCVRQIESAGRPLALFCAAFVAFLPTQTATDASISNDSLSFTAAAISTLFLVRIARVGAQASWKDKAALGIALGLCLWSKMLLLALFPAVVATYYYLWMKKRVQFRVAALDCILVMGVAVAVSLPWLLRNTILYGDPFAMHKIVAGMRDLGHVGVVPELSPLAYWQKVCLIGFQSYWAMFDSMFLGLPRPVYGALSLAVVAALLGLRRWAARESPSQADMSAIAALFLVAAFVVLGFIKSNTIALQSQGRYLYSALVPLTFSLRPRFTLPRPSQMAAACTHRGRHRDVSIRCRVRSNRGTILQVMAHRCSGQACAPSLQERSLVIFPIGNILPPPPTYFENITDR